MSLEPDITRRDAVVLIRNWLRDHGLTFSGSLSLSDLFNKIVWQIKGELTSAEDVIPRTEQQVLEKYGYEFGTPEELSIFIAAYILITDIREGKYNRRLGRHVPSEKDMLIEDSNLDKYINLLDVSPIQGYTSRINPSSQMSTPNKKTRPLAKTSKPAVKKALVRKPVAKPVVKKSATVRKPAVKTPVRKPVVKRLASPSIFNKSASKPVVKAPAKTAANPARPKAIVKPAVKQSGVKQPAVKQAPVKKPVAKAPAKSIAKPLNIPKVNTPKSAAPARNPPIKDVDQIRKEARAAVDKIRLQQAAPIKQDEHKPLPYKIRPKGPNRKPVTRLGGKSQ